MIAKFWLAAALVGPSAVALLPSLAGESPTPTPAAEVSPRLAPLAVRLQNARSVKVATSILGVKLGSTLDSAHALLDKLSDPNTPPREEGEEKKGHANGEDEHKVLWQFSGTEYNAMMVKADDKERVTSMTASLRPGKETSFDKIGEVSKAPVYTDTQVAWDVLQPNHPLVRVVASGADHKAATISIFIVKRPLLDAQLAH